MVLISHICYLCMIFMMLRITLEDISERIITNANILIVLSIACIATFVSGELPNLILMMAVLIAGFILFFLNVIGGGDVKLIAALSVSFSFERFFDFIICVALLGGVIGIVSLIFYRENVRKNGIPYGFPIALAFIICYPF